MFTDARLRCTLVALLLAVVPSIETVGQGPLPSVSPPSETPQQADRITFSIDDWKGIERNRRWQEVAVLEAQRILASRLKGELDDPGGWRTDRAVRLLGTLRASDQDIPDLLCKHLTVRPEVTGTHWTDVFQSAMALIRIGGPNVANAVINHLKQPRSETELLLCGQILHRNDAHEITFARFEMAMAEAKPKMKPEAYEVFARNLAQIKEWLSDPNYAFDWRYSPDRTAIEQK